jgi:hypothetical protein
MTGQDDLHRDMASLVVPRAGFLQATGGPWDPYRLVDRWGEVAGPVAVYLRDLQAAGRTAATQRSYGMDLLRWFRFCWAIGVPWDQVTRSEARDFCRWIQIAAKPGGARRRTGRGGSAGEAAADIAPAAPKRRAANPVTGKPGPGGRYAASTAAHCESVLRQFYDFHLEAGSGPMVNPFPLDRRRRGGRAGAHHNPMAAHRDERSGLFRPRLAQRIPRSIPDERFSELFAQLTSHRDRALVALWVSTGARAAELLGASSGDADAGAAADHGDPQGDAADAAASGVPGRVRVAALVSGADAGPGAGRPGSAVVVDAAAAVPAADLSRRSPHVRPGQRGAGSELDAS